MSRSQIPGVIAVAGLEPTGAAGLLRDALVAQACGATFHGVPTAVTPPGGHGPAVIVEARSPAQIAAHLGRALLAQGYGADGGDCANCAVKVGMVASADSAAVIAGELNSTSRPVVFDPVLASSQGARLFQHESAFDTPGGMARALAPLLARADLITPNRDELAALAGRPVVDRMTAQEAARHLLASGIRAVLIKGGHFDEEAREISDLLIEPGGTHELKAARIAGPSPRGTGCALSTAIAVEMARGHELKVACENARAWLQHRIAGAVMVGSERHLGF